VDRQRARPRTGANEFRKLRSTLKSVSRFIRILVFFDDTRRPADVIEISEFLAYPRSLTSALLRSLVTMGYLNYDAHARTYLPTTRTTSPGDWVNNIFREGRMWRLMEEVNRRTGDNVILATRNGLFAQNIYMVKATSPGRPHLTHGAREPLAGSATGRVILSIYPDEEVNEIITRINSEAPSAEWRVKTPDVLSDIAEIRTRGYALSVNGGSVLAMPVPGSSSVQPLALAIVGLAEVLNARRDPLIEMMREQMKQHLANVPPKVVSMTPRW
jgi:DNA-binding IclR family transcriptional regulator